MAIEEASEFLDENEIFELEGVRKIKNFRFQVIRKKYIDVDLLLYKKKKQGKETS